MGIDVFALYGLYQWGTFHLYKDGASDGAGVSGFAAQADAHTNTTLHARKTQRRRVLHPARTTRVSR